MRAGGWKKQKDTIPHGGEERTHREDVEQTQGHVGFEKMTHQSRQEKAVQVRGPETLIGRSPAQGDT